MEQTDHRWSSVIASCARNKQHLTSLPQDVLQNLHEVLMAKHRSSHPRMKPRFALLLLVPSSVVPPVAPDKDIRQKDTTTQCRNMFTEGPMQSQTLQELRQVVGLHTGPMWHMEHQVLWLLQHHITIP